MKSLWRFDSPRRRSPKTGYWFTLPYVVFFGTFVASFIIAIINPGIVAAGWLAYWTQLIYGLIIVVSVALQAVLRKRLA